MFLPWPYSQALVDIVPTFVWQFHPSSCQHLFSQLSQVGLLPTVLHLQLGD